MKKILILMIAISLFAILSKAIATTNDYDEIAKSDKVGVTIYAKKLNGLYTDFKIDFQGSILSKPYWINTTSPTWSPEIIYEDISQDGKKELLIILTKGIGTGVLEREVHVFQTQQQISDKTQSLIPVEVPVDEPLAILLKNVKTELTPNKAIVSIGDNKYTVDIKPLGIRPGHLFDEIYFGNLINFEIKNNQLVAKLGGQISPVGGYIGDIQISYIFRDKMYQVKSIEFIPYD
ncbi:MULTISPECIES: hypothetical protein [unclassified Lysinibacillus]|uniref:hypothetical protein n=1 Tax=unclassified Lysinibacillus TaxID=2636778 RepID=UPI000884CED8|nr:MULTISPECIES: hypothetical protein [unclassified Lysinibacillus]SCY41795.1 hypothetical protein SAMN02787078_01498 [Lysinibacillus sp. SG9]SDB19274.1 hypothetical protein SAMN02787079_01500 [Lysinibacillus sp. TC-37]SFS67727.1 hypothetical protein SAMN02787087_01505 [Lysinibacillus sp. SG55]